MARDTHRAHHAAMARRREQAQDILDKLKDSRRVVLSGGPRTGKSTLAVRAGERYGRTVRHADSLIGQKDWSEASDEVAKWIGEDGEWIVEGVSAPRALRKLLSSQPGKRLEDLTVVHFREPVQFQTDKQKAMAKGVETVWQQIREELRARGANVIERETGPAPETAEDVYEAMRPSRQRATAAVLKDAEREPEPDINEEPPTIRNAR